MMRMLSLSKVVIAFAVFGRGTPATAAPVVGTRPALLELFTSQGCSSCPPADALVRRLAALGLGSDKVVPLTFHVDYWDGLGWKDPFASAAFTKRQEWYVRSRRLRSPAGTQGLDGPYTPQMIVDGQVHFSGQRQETAVNEIEAAARRSPLFALAVKPTVSGLALDVLVRSTPSGTLPADRDWRLVAALTAKQTRTAVARGENAGETLEEAAVVRALSDRIPVAPAGATTRLQLSRPADLAWREAELVVFIQSETTHEIAAVSSVVLVP